MFQSSQFWSLDPFLSYFWSLLPLKSQQLLLFQSLSFGHKVSPDLPLLSHPGVLVGIDHTNIISRCSGQNWPHQHSYPGVLVGIDHTNIISRCSGRNWPHQHSFHLGHNWPQSHKWDGGRRNLYYQLISYNISVSILYTTYSFQLRVWQVTSFPHQS